MGAPEHAEPAAGDGLTDEALLGFLYQVPVGLLALDLSGHIAMANPMAVQWLMPLLAEARLDNFFTALAPRLPDLAERVQALPAEPGHPGLQCRLEDPGPPRRLLDLQLMRLGPDRLMVSVSDVTLAEAQTQQRLAAQWQDAQRTDALTAMPNRRALLELLGQRLRGGDAVLPDATGLALLLVNLDRFERINTRLGPEAGDAVLREVAQRLVQGLRQHDHVAAGTTARLGGDEFVVLLDGLATSDAAQRVAQRLLQALAQPCHVAGQTVHLSASIGVVAAPHLAGPAETVLHDAALAMREAKRAGGGVQVLFCPDTRDQALATARLEHELRLALEPQQDQLFVVYQPIVPLQPDQIPGVEALVRWRHPQRGLVPPDAFIGVAESSGLIVPLGAQVLRSACRQFMAWQQTLGERAPRKMSVNLSLAQLVDAGFVDEVAQTLRDCAMPAKALQLEVTESMASRDPGMRALLVQLKALGVTLALDDFGTGYSSLACLHQLPVDVVKIDRSFVSQLEHSVHHQVLVQATLMVAHSLGMATVAEGVETPAQEAALRRLGCGSAQGYRFARPLPAAELSDWLVAAPPAPSAPSASAEAG